MPAFTVTESTMTTIPRAHLLKRNVPEDLLPKSKLIDVAHLRGVAAILKYAARPVALPPEIQMKGKSYGPLNRLSTLAHSKAANNTHKPKRFPERDDERDSLICALLFATAFPKVAGVINETPQGALGTAFWHMCDKFRALVAERIPPLAAAAARTVPTLSKDINLSPKHLEMFEHIGAAIDTILDEWLEAHGK